MGEPIRWSDAAQEVISGDITTAAAYLTPAGGAVVTAVATFGIADRDRGMVGSTTSLGFPKKLERIIGDPRVALAYHGVLAKFGVWRAQRRGTAERLEQLAADKANLPPGPQPARVSKRSNR